MRIDVEVPTTLSDLDFYAQIGAFVSFELIHIVIILLGGIALFLFGMQLMGDGLKKVAVVTTLMCMVILIILQDIYLPILTHITGTILTI